MGWDPSKGLGATGEGRTSHIKVSHKLDMLGIGAAHTKDPNGIAWKQNKDFEDVLRRLNDSAQKDNGDKVDEVSDAASVNKSEKRRKRRKERDAEDKKVDEVVGEGDATSVGKSEKKRKRKKEEEVEDKKKSKKSKKSKELEAGLSQKQPPESVTVTPVKPFTSRVGA